MLLRSVILLMISINMIRCRPQFVSFKDGKIGINFGGYHAEAGLGALLTGNAAHGGLSASAGTPYGQRAAAGIGGGTGENSQGGAYASASAGGNVGASAGLGAVAGGDAGVGAEAHVGSLSTSANRGYLAGSQVSKQATSVAAINNNGNPNQNNVIYRRINNGYDGGEIDGNAQTTNIIKESHIQRIKPPKKYARVHGHAHVAQPSNTVTVVEKTAAIASPQPSEQIFVGKTFETVPTVGKNNVITKTKTKSISSSSSTPYGGTTYQQRANDNNGYGGGSVAGTGAISANFNAAGLFDSIFNIPIATLKAVNGLVNNVANSISASGSVAVSKSIGTGPH